jgi:hypothetical protein
MGIAGVEPRHAELGFKTSTLAWAPLSAQLNNKNIKGKRKNEK